MIELTEQEWDKALDQLDALQAERDQLRRELELSHSMEAQLGDTVRGLSAERDELRLALQEAQQKLTTCKVHLTTFNENEVCPQCWTSMSSHRKTVVALQESQQRVNELEAYKAHQKTCLELAEEFNRDITLERRVNSSLRAKVEQQQTVIQELAETLQRTIKEGEADRLERKE